MRRAWRIVLAAAMLAPFAAAQANLTLPLEAPAPPVVEASPGGVALQVPGALDANVTAGRNGTVPLSASLTLDLGLAGLLPPLPVPPSPPPPPAPAGSDGFPRDPFGHGLAAPGDAPAQPPDLLAPGSPQRDPDSPPPPPLGVAALASGLGAPFDVPSVAGAVAVGATALLAVAARLFSRFERSELLRDETRSQLCALLEERPGATLPDLMAWTGASRGALVHHARMLERHGLVASRHDGLNRRFYPGGGRLAILERPPTPGERRVLDLLEKEGPLTQAEIAARLGVTVQAVSYHLVRLRKAARVEADPERRWRAPLPLRESERAAGDASGASG